MRLKNNNKNMNIKESKNMNKEYKVNRNKKSKVNRKLNKRKSDLVCLLCIIYSLFENLFYCTPLSYKLIKELNLVSINKVK